MSDYWDFVRAMLNYISTIGYFIKFYATWCLKGLKTNKVPVMYKFLEDENVLKFGYLYWSPNLGYLVDAWGFGISYLMQELNQIWRKVASEGSSLAIWYFDK